MPRLAGQIDAVFLDEDWRIALVDWKRSALLRTDSRGSMRYPLDHLPDSNYWHYALQLNVYRMILESEYCLTVSRLFLAVVHPECAPRLIELPLLDAEMRVLHCSEIEQGRAAVSAPGLDARFAV